MKDMNLTTGFVMMNLVVALVMGFVAFNLDVILEGGLYYCYLLVMEVAKMVGM